MPAAESGVASSELLGERGGGEVTDHDVEERHEQVWDLLGFPAVHRWGGLEHGQALGDGRAQPVFQ